MPATLSSCDEYGEQIFPAADMYCNQDTLEAVLRQPVTAPRRPAAEWPADDGTAPVAVDRGGVVLDDRAPQRRRPPRTDRHSKIRTAQGVRDRRMRLSVGVARDFFALQDRLGFDKASKTVSWLLTQSKPAIDRLRDDAAGVPPAPASVRPPAVMTREKGEGSSSSSRDKVRTNRSGLDGAAARMDEHGGRGELHLPEAAVATTEQQTQPMDGLEYYYQYYQLEEMMRCSNGGVQPR